LNDITLLNKSSERYEASLVIWDHTVLRCYLSPDTSGLAPPNSSQTGWYSIYLPRRDGRLSWRRWFVTHRDSLPVSRQSPIQVVTGSDVEQLQPLHHAETLDAVIISVACC